MNRIEKGSLLVLAIIVAFNIFFGLGSIPLLDPDEPVYAETAREMIQFNDYLSPRIYNEYWFDKPPMYYWLVAGAMHVFGDGEFAARFPAALMAFLTVIMLYCSITRLFNERTGFWSALVLATSVQFFYLGKAAVTDTTLLFFLTGSLLCYLHKQYWLDVCVYGAGHGNKRADRDRFSRRDNISAYSLYRAVAEAVKNISTKSHQIFTKSIFSRSSDLLSVIDALIDCWRL